MTYLILLILSIPLLAFVLSSLRLNNPQQKLLTAMILLLCLIGGLRGYDTFNDSASYATHFDNIHDSGAFYDVPVERMEKGYLILEKFIHKHISKSYTALFLITSFFSIGTALYFYYKKSKLLWLSVFLFVGMRVYFMHIQAIRQSIAMAIIMIAYLLLEKKKIKWAILLCVLATTFHSTAVIALGIIPLYYIPFEKKYVIPCVITATGAMFFLGQIFEIMGYGDSTYLQDENMKLGNIVELTTNSIFLFFCWIMNKNAVKEERLMAWGALLCTLCLVVSLFVTAFNRAVYYFQPCTFVLLANIIRLIRNKRTYTTMLCGVIMIYYITVLTIKPEWNKAYPYRFFWEDRYYITSNQ